MFKIIVEDIEHYKEIIGSLVMGEAPKDILKYLEISEEIMDEKNEGREL